MRFRIVVIAVAAALFISPSIKADTISFGSCAQLTPVDPSCANHDSGQTKLRYTSGGLIVDAYGYSFGPPLVGTNLYIKQGGPDETGLGTAKDINHEVNIKEFIDLDLSSLVAHHIFSGMLTLESLQVGEGYKACKGSALGSLGGSCTFGGAGTGTSTIPLSWTGSQDIIGITALNADGQHPAANVLIEGLTVTPVPEPSSLTLLCVGIAGLTGLRRKALKK